MSTFQDATLEHAHFDGAVDSKRIILQTIVEMRHAGETVTSTSIAERVDLSPISIRVWKSKDPAFALALDIAMGTKEPAKPTPKPVTPQSEIAVLERELVEAKAEVRTLKRWNRNYGDCSYKLNRAVERVHGIEGLIERIRNPRVGPYDL